MLKFLQRNKYLVLVAALVLAGSYGGYKYYQSTQIAAQTVKTGRVTRGDLTETVSATGSLTALDNVDISSKITGRIVEVLVKENQHVNAGDVLVRLDDTALKATLAQMEAKLVNARLTYKRDLDLLDRGAISQAVFDAAYADYLVAKSKSKPYNKLCKIITMGQACLVICQKYWSNYDRNKRSENKKGYKKLCSFSYKIIRGQ